MSEKLFKILLSELTKIRIVCKSCGSAVEIPIIKLVSAGNIKCPICPTQLHHERGSHLPNLAEAMIELKQKKEIEIEFIVPDKEPEDLK